MRTQNRDVAIHYQVVGEGRPVVLLHGFPDTGSRLWRHQVPALAAAGFRVIVPDQRGYGRSDKPGEVASYGMGHLVADLVAVLDDAGVDRAHVVGHDWGAAVAWAAAVFVPARVDHLAVLSVGHPASFRAAGYEQRQRSWYMLLFQFEGIAERWLSDDGWARFKEWSGHPDAELVVEELERDRSLTPALNWYRAIVPPSTLLDPPLELPPVRAPTMGVWSTQDLALTEAQMTGSAGHVEGPWRYERLEGAGHWMQLEVPDEVNGLLLDFLPS